MSRPLMLRTNRGFTLIELMLTVAVMSVLLGLAIPVYQDLIASQRVKSAISDLNTAMVFARSEAVKRNSAVTLSPAAGGWVAGWRIASPVAGNPDLLNHTQAGGIGIASASTGIVFGPSGRPTAAAAFEITSDVNANATRCLILDIAGRAEHKQDEC